MNASGLLLILGGIWLLFQVLGGELLQRLNVPGFEATP